MHHPTLGSLFAGIGGFDLGFERAGWRTAWQVEIDPFCRAVLEHHFPGAQRRGDIRDCGAKNLRRVACITAGFPCQDISASGNSAGRANRFGFSGARSGLVHEALRVIRELRPTWVVFENVEGLLHRPLLSDMQTLIQSLAGIGYLGCWRVLDARYFGIPQRRRRVFVVGGFGRFPPMELLFDAGPVEPVSSSFDPEPIARGADGWPGYTLQALNSPSRITLGGELFVAEENGWGAMVERARAAAVHGLCLGLAPADSLSAQCAGNAVCPQVAEWIARKLLAVECGDKL